MTAVWLSADIARCRPGCADLGPTCARLQAPMPAVGAPIVNGVSWWRTSRITGQIMPDCGGYVPLSEATPPELAPPRRIYPPIGERDDDDVAQG